MNHVNKFFFVSLVFFLASSVGSAALPVGEGWIRNSAGEYLGLGPAGEFMVLGAKQATAPFVFEAGSAPDTIAIKSKEKNAYLVVLNLQGLDAKGLTAGTADLARLRFLNDSSVDAARPMFFVVESLANDAVKIKGASAPNPYLLISPADKIVRAFSADASKSGRYALPVSQAAATSFVFEVASPVQKALVGLTALTALTIPLVKIDLKTRFASAFRIPSRSPADEAFLLQTFINYVAAAKLVAGFKDATDAEPSAYELSCRALDYVLQAIDYSASIKKLAQDFLDALTGPWLPLPVAINDYIALKISDGQYLAKNTAGEITIVQSPFDPAAQFVVKDYYLPGGRIALGIDASYLKFDPVNLKLSLDPALQYLQVLRDSVDDKKFVFSLFRNQVSFNVQLGSASNVIVKTMSVVPLSSVVRSLNRYASKSVEENLKTTFLDAVKKSGTSLADWKYLLDTFNAYVTSSVVTAPNYTAPIIASVGSSQDLVSLRDLAVDILTIALADPAVVAGDAVLSATKQAARALLSSLKNALVVMPDVATAPPELPLSVGDVVVIAAGDLGFLKNSSGNLQVVSPNALDDSARFVVAGYNKATGRISFKSGDMFIGFAPGGARLILGATQQFLDVVRDSAVFSRFAFAYAGKSISFAATSFGLQSAAVPIQNFECVRVPTSGTNLLNGLAAISSNKLTVQAFQVDVLMRFEPAFVALGNVAGDSDVFVRTVVAYLARVKNDVPSWEAVTIPSSLFGTKKIKDYVIGLLSSLYAEFSQAPSAVQKAAKAFVDNLQGTGASSAGPVESLSLAQGAVVLWQLPSQNLSSSKTVAVSDNGGIQLISNFSKFDAASHIKIVTYDAAKKTVKLGWMNKFFDPTLAAFSGTSKDAVAGLVLEPVKIGAVTYYYLNKGSADQRLNISDADPAVVSFGPNGSLSNMVPLDARDYSLDELSDPLQQADLEKTLILFSDTFDYASGDFDALAAYVLKFGEYCQKAMKLSSWSVGVQGSLLLGVSPQKYAQSLLVALQLMSNNAPSLKKAVTDVLKTDPFVISQDLVAGQDQQQVDAGGGSQRYQQLDARTGNLVQGLAEFDAALKAAYNSPQDLSTILVALKAYVLVAVTRVDWTNVQTSSLVATLTLVGDARYFADLNSEQKDLVAEIMALGRDLSAAYPAKIKQLDVPAAKITNPLQLVASSDLVAALNALIPDIMAYGSLEQRKALVSKIDTYFDSAIPALRAKNIDVQQNAWSQVMFTVLCNTLQFDASSSDLVIEKIDRINDVFIRRIQLIDQLIQPDIMLSLIDPCLVKLAVEFKAVSQPSVGLVGKMQNVLALMDNFVVQLYDAQEDLGLRSDVLEKLKTTMAQVWVSAGLRMDVLVKPAVIIPAVIPKPVQAIPVSRPVQPRALVFDDV